MRSTTIPDLGPDLGAELRDIRERLVAGELSVEKARVLVASVKVAMKLVALEDELATGRLQGGDVPTFRRDGKQRPRA